MSSMEAEVPAKRIPAVALLRGEWIGTLKITSTATVILGKAPHESDPKGRRGSGPLATMHVAPGTCKSIAASHLRLRYVPSLSRWVAELLGKTTSMRINDQKYDAGCRPIVLASQDRIELPCETHGAHAMYWLLPVDTPKYPYISSLEPFSLLLSAGYTPFSRTEREQYMKGLLAFGHRRPEEIKRSQRGLDQRSVEEVYEFGISLFIRFLDLLLPQEAEERDYVTKVLKLENRFILCELVSLKRPTEPSLSGWKKVEKSAGSWVRRLTNLHYLHELFTLHETMGYDLLTGVPPGDLRKRKPADHWSLADDRMLLQGIYKHGYGNFDPIREDKEFVFGPKVEWPGLEKLNKRVKKILDGGKRSFLNLSKSFLNGAKASVFDDGFIPDISEDFDTWECKDSTCAAIENVPVWQSKVESLQRWKVTEIARFLEVLLDFGLRKTYDSDIDWDWIRQYGQLWDKLDRTLLDMLDNFLRCSEGLHSDEVSVISRTEAVVLVERLVLFEDIRGLVLNHYPDLAMAIQKTGPMLWVDPPAGRADAHAMLKVFHLGLTNALSTDDFPFKSEEEYLPRLSEAVTHMKNWFRAQNDWVELPGFKARSISRKRSRSPIYFRSKEDGSILLPVCEVIELPFLTCLARRDSNP